MEARSQAESQPGLLRNPRFVMSLGLILMIMFSMYLPIPLAANFLQNEHGLSLASIGQLVRCKTGERCFRAGAGASARIDGFSGG